MSCFSIVLAAVSSFLLNDLCLIKALRGDVHWAFFDINISRRLMLRSVSRDRMRSIVRVGEGLARLRGSVFVVVSEIAVFTQTLGIVRLARVRAEPRLLGSSLPVVTVDAHALCIVSLIRVGAIGDLSLAQIVVGAEDFRHDFCLVWLSGSYLKFGSFLSNLILLSVLINIIADVTRHYMLLGKSLV